MRSNIYNSTEIPSGPDCKRDLSIISTRLRTQLEGRKAKQVIPTVKQDHNIHISTNYNTKPDSYTASPLTPTEVTDQLLHLQSKPRQFTYNTEPDPETSSLISLAVAVSIERKTGIQVHQTLTHISKMPLKRSRPSLRLKRPKSILQPLTLLTPPDSPPSPESRLPQRIVGTINVAIVRYLANIPIHSKDKREIEPRSGSDTEDGTPPHSPNSQRRSSSSSSTYNPNSPHESLSIYIINKLSRCSTFLSYMKTLFSLYHQVICPSIRHHYTSIYNTWSALSSEDEYNSLLLEEEMEKLTDWAVPGIGNALELAKKRYLSELGENTPVMGAKGGEELRYFKHLVDRFGGLQTEGGEVVIRMAREKLVGRRWDSGN